MSTFAVVPQDAFDEMQLDAGVLLTEFDPADRRNTDYLSGGV